MENSNEKYQEAAARAAALTNEQLLEEMGDAHRNLAKVRPFSDDYGMWTMVRMVAEREILARLEGAGR